MGKEYLQEPPVIAKPAVAAPEQTHQGTVHILGLSLCALGMILCTLIGVAPVLHLAGKTFLLGLPSNRFLLAWGAWLPHDLHLVPNSITSVVITNNLEYAILVAAAFVFYGLALLSIWIQPEHGNFKFALAIIVGSTLVIGVIYVLTPAMLSRDIFVYAGYGRTIAAHHANPYFVTPSTFPNDPITGYDDWKKAVSAYGPFWLVVCAAWSFILGAWPLGYLLAFRLFGLAVHLLNILLVATILRKLGHSNRTIALSSLLYALSPLALMESSMGAHNDIFMIMFILLGVVLAIRAQLQHFARPALYLPPIIAFTLATLVKFTAAPLIVFYLVLFARNLLLSSATPEQAGSSVMRKLVAAIATGGLVGFVFYAPFWLGHSIHSIIVSFTSPPSSYYSENSLMRAFYDWVKAHGLPAQSSWNYVPLYVFSQHPIWNVINFVVLLGAITLSCLWLWRSPSIHTFILAALTTLTLLLVVTPWFFSWYVTWLVGLAAITLPTIGQRYSKALVAFVLAFSLTAFLTYFRALGDWTGFSWMTMIGIPVLVFCLVIAFKQKTNQDFLTANSTMEQYDKDRYTTLNSE